MPKLSRATLKQLRALAALTEEGTINAAAERLSLTGPAVHSQLKSLEELVGAPLLQTVGKDRNRPTEQGQALLDAYHEINAALDRAGHRIAALNAGLEGSVVLGVVSTGKYFAPRIVAHLHREMPGVDIVLRIGNRQEILQALESRELDICIMGRPPRAPEVDARAIADHPHVLISAADHALATRARLTAEDLLAHPFVLREGGSGTRILATRFLDETCGTRLPETVEMTSNETIKQSVIHGLGIALISAHTVEDELRSGRLVALPFAGLPIYRTWFLLSRLDQPLTPSARRVRDWIQDRAPWVLPDMTGLLPPQ